MAAAADRVHATVIARDGDAALIRGASGSGKSDLALRCLALSKSALVRSDVRLVADDQVLLSRDDQTIVARAPPSLSGLLEVRGVGIISVAAIEMARISLIVDLRPDARAERLPDPWPSATLLGVSIPLLLVAPFEPSAPLKVLIALAEIARLRHG